METSEYAGFVKDLQTGAILGISNKRAFVQIEIDNKNLIKKDQGRLIRFEVLSETEGIKAYIEHYNKVNNIVTTKAQPPVIEKKPVIKRRKRK